MEYIIHPTTVIKRDENIVHYWVELEDFFFNQREEMLIGEKRKQADSGEEQLALKEERRVENIEKEEKGVLQGCVCGLRAVLCS